MLSGSKTTRNGELQPYIQQWRQKCAWEGIVARGNPQRQLGTQGKVTIYGYKQGGISLQQAGRNMLNSLIWWTNLVATAAQTTPAVDGEAWKDLSPPSILSSLRETRLCEWWDASLSFSWLCVIRDGRLTLWEETHIMYICFSALAWKPPPSCKHGPPFLCGWHETVIAIGRGSAHHLIKWLCLLANPLLFLFCGSCCQSWHVSVYFCVHLLTFFVWNNDDFRPYFS